MTRLISRIPFYILLLLIVGLFTQVALAQDEPVSDDAVNEVAKDIYCPVCENTPLDVCATQACADWRELIREKLGEGQTQEEIFNYFATQYGDGVLANPPNRGLNMVFLWLIPTIIWISPIALVLMAMVVFFVLYVRKSRAVENESEIVPMSKIAPPPALVKPVGPKTEASDDYTARVEDELRGKSE